MGKRVSIADTLFFVEILIRCQNIRLTLLAAEVCSVRLRLFYLYPDFTRLGVAIFQLCAFLLSLLDLDTRPFGTAISTPPRHH